MICASMYLRIVSRNLLVHLAKKIPLMQNLTFGGVPNQCRSKGYLSSSPSCVLHAMNIKTPIPDALTH